MTQTRISQPVAELPVVDVVQAQEYYRDTLGFTIEWNSADLGAVARGDVAIFFRQVPGAILPNTHWVFAPDVDETYRELTESGADVIEPIEDKPWGHRQFAIRDLNGHIFYFHHA